MPEEPYAAERAERPVVISLAKRKSTFNLVGCALVSIGGLLFLVLTHSVVDRLAGSFLFVFAGVIALAGFRRLRSREPLLLVTESGIEHPVLGLIEWDQIKALTIKDGPHSRRLNVDVVDQKSFLTRAPSRAYRLLMQINLLVGYELLSISEQVTKMSPELLRDLIEQRAGRTWPH